MRTTPRVAGFRSEYPAGFELECMAGFVGIRMVGSQNAGALIVAMVLGGGIFLSSARAIGRGLAILACLSQEKARASGARKNPPV
jgi:hypothetical protein